MLDRTLILVALISATPPTLMALLAYRESRKTHLTINSRMSELLEVTKSDALAQGKAEGKIEEREEVFQRERIV